MARVATEALRILHFDPETDEDHGERDGCGIACYQCLLSYRNQIHHVELNRFLVRELLQEWQADSGSRAVVVDDPGSPA